jgi:hypothetical protein
MSEPLNAVIDISHHDGNVNLAKAKETPWSPLWWRCLSASGAQPAPPFAPCPGGGRLGGLPPGLQMQAEVLELDF